MAASSMWLTNRGNEYKAASGPASARSKKPSGNRPKPIAGEARGNPRRHRDQARVVVEAPLDTGGPALLPEAAARGTMGPREHGERRDHGDAEVTGRRL